MNGEDTRPPVVFIAGPTASGKSAAALEVAQAFGGEIVNADSMQVYRDLHILTARPGAADEAAVPHHLYGWLDGAERCSAGRWARAAARTIEAIRARGRPAIVTGGTGLYFRSLRDGLSPIPDIRPEVREAAAARREVLGPAAFRAEVLARDPGMGWVPEGDAQRLTRAWEVFEATGAPLSELQKQPGEPLVSGNLLAVVIEPERAALYARCDARLAGWMGEAKPAALGEVEALLARGLDPALPVMRALGVREFARFLSGEADLEDALAQAQMNTRRFAKRQLTWFRSQAREWPRAECADAAVRFIASGLYNLTQKR